MTGSDQWVLRINYGNGDPEITIPEHGTSYEECLRRFDFFVKSAILHPNYDQIITMDHLTHDGAPEEVFYETTYWQFYWDFADHHPVICSFHFPTPPCPDLNIWHEWNPLELIDVYHAFCAVQKIVIET